MKFMIIPFLALALLNCGKATVDARLVPYFNDFNNEITMDTGFITGKISPLATPLLGLCDGTTITVDEAYFNTASEADIKHVVFHELGHCALGLSHVSDLKADGCPITVMFPGYGQDNKNCFINGNKYYMDELRSHIK